MDDSDSATADERTTIRAGRAFETEYRLDSKEAGEFLIALGEQLRDGDELTLVDEEWELPFAFGEPIDVEIDFDGVGDQELEIEVEIPGRSDESAPDVR
ncbi:amphi-Trp domain-containing protein [Natronomonas sp. CBA1123]|uniref:amphi-Trp domain-containing protein n=1 Tax=Natronomonas sp. CBA1123 TaxID=2668070 RepID=UPI001307C6E2|nr:amphi-Trp domain-containing protein [Natronomonas sp. CBA1123]